MSTHAIPSHLTAADNRRPNSSDEVLPPSALRKYRWSEKDPLDVNQLPREFDVSDLDVVRECAAGSTSEWGEFLKNTRNLSLAAAPESGIGTYSESFVDETIVPPTNFDELFPIMASLRRDKQFIDMKPARDIFLIGRLHLTTSAIAAIDVLMTAGILTSNILLIAKNYDYAHGDFVGKLLHGRGIRIVMDKKLSDGLLNEVAEHLKRNQLRLLTIEDGAEIVTRIHAKPNLLPFWIGGAEQTTRGVWRLEELGVQQPVVALPTSRIKADFEGPHIAASGIHATKNFFPGICVADWRVAVLGLGTIGRHLLIAADELGCDVVGFDQDPIKRLRCRHLRAKAIKSNAIDAIRGADLIIGTAGRLTIDADILAAANTHVRIGSLSSERVETDVEYLERCALRHEVLLRYPIGFPENRLIGTRFTLPNRRTVDLLCNGTPINFSNLGVLCEKHTDLIVGWLILCGLEVACAGFYGRKGVLTDAADFVFQKHDLARQYERFWA